MACKKTIPNQPLNGQLIGRPPLSDTQYDNFRVQLNTSMPDQDRLGRMPGWHGLGKYMDDSDRCNRDLHDQLLHCVGYYTSTVLTQDAIIGFGGGPNTELHVESTEGFAVTPDQDQISIRGFQKLFRRGAPGNKTLTVQNMEGKPIPEARGGNVYRGDEVIGPWVQPEAHREVITLVTQARSMCDSFVMLAATRSRLYESTGASGNWRLLADGLGATPTSEPTPYTGTRWMSAQLANYVLFTNDYNPVIAYRIGDQPTCAAAWSAHYIQQLVELGILAAGCIASWKGVIFIGDVTTENGRQCSQIYWSDFNSPLDWEPIGESSAGFVDLGDGEKVLRMEPMGGNLRVYTDRAIYNVVLVGGDEVFRFVEVYRGPDALAFRYAFANCGDVHVYLTSSSIVEVHQYVNMPVRTDWMHSASGFLFYGMDGKLLTDYPGNFRPFQRFDRTRCDQVIAGYDSQRREIWFSWPTLDVDSEDPENTRRMTMVMARLYGHTSLVDHGFSAFTEFVQWEDMLVRHWMVSVGACTHAEGDALAGMKEGVGCNSPPEADPKPSYLINPTENPDLPVHPDSVCALYGDHDIMLMCAPCDSPRSFAMASLRDLTIKELNPDERYREVWDDFTKVYWDDGYEFIVQSETSLYGYQEDKQVYALDVDFVTTSTDPLLHMHAQIGVGPMASCPKFWNSVPEPMMCQGNDEEPESRPTGPLYYPFFCRGRFVTWRLYVSDVTGEIPNYRPTGGIFDLTRVSVTLSAKNKC